MICATGLPGGYRGRSSAAPAPGKACPHKSLVLVSIACLM